jgi:hypothetical protein
MVQVPINLPAGSDSIKVTWQALEALPHGKTLDGDPLVETAKFQVVAAEEKP